MDPGVPRIATQILAYKLEMFPNQMGSSKMYLGGGGDGGGVGRRSMAAYEYLKVYISSLFSREIKPSSMRDALRTQCKCCYHFLYLSNDFFIQVQLSDHLAIT